MYYAIAVLTIIVCILLVLIVLVQNSKGGGLAANFASSNQVMGVRKTTDFLEKGTWVLAIALLVLSMLASITIPRTEEAKASAMQKQISNAIDPAQGPNIPTQAPDQNAPQPK
ncbi:MAG: preprotein translocase subunit SecG [Bacteroidetes bacterium RIFOXYA12_FULL_35_11]|nr:MAG: preprotein translocase subunit SecG [Bacteroidetes bacterium GWF2_35_48]OFY79566.1 MAG: preprotein translocase subunit SecG [Bacteroidetes bacterium RIFOXYA12_FULL_35_11]OFY96435.1 MAG: preprotein translocase subunit SecG [Bacteroidetes bacterium RIFOXYC12_FULL_35_7]HBX50515.1 preprotein translocase subunit SecG [Bacteroidales bacterium]